MYYRSLKFLSVGCLLLALSSGIALSSLAQEPAQDEVPLAPKKVRTGEIYRLRVENNLYGGVALSTDGGRRYTLVGRVLHPATAVSVDRAASEPGIVLRSMGEGVAFSVNFGQVLKLRPAPKQSSALPNALQGGAPRPGAAISNDPATIVTNIPSNSSLFRFQEMPLPVGVHARMEVNSRLLQPFSTLYAPSTDDVFVFVVTDRDLDMELQMELQKALLASGQNPPTGNPDGQANQTNKTNETKDGNVNNLPVPWGSPEAIRSHIDALGEAYLQESLTRATQEKRTLINGNLKLRAKLPPNEPDPIAFVTYTVDGQFVATQNEAPFDFDLDTRKLADGEHVIEIRALNRNTRPVTLKRSLITVWNRETK